jgi:hypothetical protein
METGKLSKLKIQAYSDKGFSNKVENGEFTTYMNPEKYTYHYKIEQNKTQASGTSDLAAKFSKKLPEELEIEFLFDRTGVLPDYPATRDGVIDDLNKFKDIILKYNGDEHKPNYLTITWGSLLFKGSMSDMSIEFKLFKSDGAPIRAVAKVKFTGFTEDKLRVARENNSSPDLTHYRIVKEGDTLPLMTYRIYGDSKYYLEVAKVNKLPNFRKLTAGQRLVFPPIQKQS